MKTSILLQDTPYKVDLNRCGSRFSETLTLIEEYNKTKSWNELLIKATEENVLNKNSSTTIKNVLSCFRKRFKDVDGLPDLDILSLFLTSNIPEKAKIQTLFPYICITDSLILQYMLKLIGPQLVSNEVSLSKKVFHDFLANETYSHPELNNWSETSKTRWIERFLSLLRRFNLMNAAPSFELKKPSLRIETFGFFCMWLLFSGKSGAKIIEDDLWKLYFLNTSEVESYLENSQKKGWITFMRSGDIISISSDYESLERWINDIG